MFSNYTPYQHIFLGLFINDNFFNSQWTLGLCLDFNFSHFLVKNDPPLLLHVSSVMFDLKLHCVHVKCLYCCFFCPDLECYGSCLNSFRFKNQTLSYYFQITFWLGFTTHQIVHLLVKSTFENNFLIWIHNTSNCTSTCWIYIWE